MKARCLFAFAVLYLMTLPGFAQSTNEWVAKARAYLGSESALNGVKSIHFEGKMEAADGQIYPIEIIFQKPYQQRILIKGPKVVETTGLDGYDAWQKRASPDNPALWQVVLLDANQVKRLRANTLENLSFYWNLTADERQVAVLGEADVDGVACVKISFSHAKDIVFLRYFEKGTGRLIKTETENGSEIREDGVMQVGGIRFPVKVTNKSAEGRSTLISFDRIRINESFSPDLFTVPSMQYK